MAVQLGSAYGQVSIDATGVRKGVGEAQQSLTALERGAQNVFQFALGNLIARGIGEMVQGIGNLAHETKSLATGFQAEMAIMSTAVDPTVASLDQLHDAAIRVGGDVELVGIDAQQAAGAMTAFFKSGLNVNDVFGDMQGYLKGTTSLSGALRSAIDLQAASALNLAQASDTVAVAMKTYGLEADQATAIADNFVQAADASVAEVEDLVAAMANVGPTAAAFGWSLQETNNALALLSTRGIQGAEAGSALKSMLNAMIRDTTDVKAAWRELNVELYDSRGVMRDFPDILSDLEGALGGMTQQQRDYYVLTLAGSYGQKALNTLLAEGRDGWEAMAEATRNASTAAEVAAARTDTLAGAQEALQGALETLLIQVGEEFIPIWTQAARGMAEAIETHGPTVINIAASIADAIASVQHGLENLHPIVQFVATALGNGFTQAAILAGGFYKLYQVGVTLIPMLSGLKVALSDAAVGYELYRSGASLAEISILGWTTTLVPLVAAFGALALSLAAVNAAIEIHNDVQRETAKTADEWTTYLGALSEAYGTAAEVAEAYAAKQQEVSDALQSQGAVAGALIDRQRVINADTKTLNQTLMQSATSYADYRAAVERVNRSVEENAYRTNVFGQRIQDAAAIAEESIRPVDELTFAVQRGEIQYAGAGRAVDVFGQEIAATGDTAVAVAEEVAAAQQAMAEQAEQAWQTFAGGVEQGVGAALEAYQAGNAELLAEQERGLAEMLWNQTETMLALGQITSDQANAMQSAIAGEFGIMVDETQVTTNALLGMYAEWAAGGEVTADEIVGFLDNIGAESDTLVERERTMKEETLAEWEAMQAGIASESEQARLAIDAMATGMSLSLETSVTSIGNVDAALRRLPTEHTFTLNLETQGEIPTLPSGPNPQEPVAFASGTDYAPGGWALVGEEGPEMMYVPRGAQIVDAHDTAAMVSGASTLMQQLAEVGNSQQTVSYTTYDQRQYHFHTEVHDDLDVELLTRRVLQELRRR